MSKNGYSREGLFGQINHYDSDGHKTGESWPSLFGGYNDYDASGHKIGRTEEQIFGIGYNHYDNDGHRIGSSDESFFGGYTERDASGQTIGYRDRSLFDIRPDEEIRATGSLYGSMYYPGHYDRFSAFGPEESDPPDTWGFDSPDESEEDDDWLDNDGSGDIFADDTDGSFLDFEL